MLDFGLAVIDDLPASTKLTVDGHLIGTPAYMAPEQIRGLPVDARADVFSLGVMLYELVTGTNPFAAADAPSSLAKILETDPPPLTAALPAGTSPDAALALEHTVMTCLRKAPAERFESAAELAGALEQAKRLLGVASNGSGTRPAPMAVGTSGRARWWWQFHQATAAVSYVVLLLPLWDRREAVGAPRMGLALFVCGLVAAVVASTLRLHRWFAVQLDPSTAPSSDSRGSRWLWAADVLFAVTLAIEGLFAVLDSPAAGVILVSAASAILVSAVVIEPSTARAAFGRE